MTVRRTSGTRQSPFSQPILVSPGFSRSRSRIGVRDDSIEALRDDRKSQNPGLEPGLCGVYLPFLLAKNGSDAR